VPQRNVENGSSVTQDKFVQKQIERLNKGREEKERIKLFMEKGIVKREDGEFNPN